MHTNNQHDRLASITVLGSAVFALLSLLAGTMAGLEQSAQASFLFAWPGALLLLYRLAPEYFRSPQRCAIALILTYLPLSNTWPARVIRWRLLPQDPVWSVLLHPETLCAGLLLLLWFSRDRSRDTRIHEGFGLVLLTYLAATLLSLPGSLDPAATTRMLVLSALLPLAIYLVVRNSDLTSKEEISLITAVLTTAAAPLLLALAGYLLDFGVPGSFSDVAWIKKFGLPQQGRLQEYSFGNIGHLTDYTLLLCFPLGVLAARLRTGALPKVIRGLLLAFLMTLCLVLVVVGLRGGALVLFFTGLICASVPFYQSAARPVLWKAAVIPILTSVLIFTVHFEYFSRLVPERMDDPRPKLSSGPARTSDQPQAAPQPSTPQHSAPLPSTPQPSAPLPSVPVPSAAGEQQVLRSREVRIRDASTIVRLGAIWSGLQITKDHFPLGTGSGAYPIADPQFTSPHSFPLRVVAETGLAGFVTLLLMTIYAFRLLRRVRQMDTVTVGLLLSCAAFLIYGTGFGGQLSVNGTAVWGCLLAFWAALIERRVTRTEEEQSSTAKLVALQLTAE